VIVLIDDERTFKPEVLDGEYLLFKTSAEALTWLESIDRDTQVDQIWFDHDLGMVDGEPDTTIPVVQRLEEMLFFATAPEIGSIVVHTSNSIGGDRIFGSMKRYFTTQRVFAGDYLEVK
jgi:hypothetical protein